MPTISRPSSVIEPVSGRNAPATRLMVLVFPEPFGPISPTISPRRSSAENSATAAMPPKCFCSMLAAKYGASGGVALSPAPARGAGGRGPPRPPIENALDERKQAVLRETLHQDEREAEQHEAPFAVVAQDFRECVDHDRADHGAGQALDAADHRHGDDE